LLKYDVFVLFEPDDITLATDKNMNRTASRLLREAGVYMEHAMSLRKTFRFFVLQYVGTLFPSRPSSSLFSAEEQWSGRTLSVW
jgi:hypothetical protein